MTERTLPVSTLVSVTATPGTAAPLESVTRPINPVLAPAWARANCSETLKSSAAAQKLSRRNRKGAGLIVPTTLSSTIES